MALYVAGVILAFFALMAVGAALASQAVDLGLVPPRVTATATPTATPVSTATPTPIPTVAVPNLVGGKGDEAQQRLTALGLQVEVAQVNDKGTPAGNVIAQDPPANTSLKVGEKVKLTVSLGPLQGPVPNVFGQPEPDAVKTLVEAGFKARSERVFDDRITSGLVVRQDPPANPQQKVDLESEVIIYVSQGKEQVAVPTVRGKTEDEARKLLGDAGFQVAVKYEAVSEAPVGRVFATDPIEGSRVDKGSAVTIRVRVEPTATATATATATPEATPQPAPPTPTITPLPTSTAPPARSPSPGPGASPTARRG